MVLAPQLWALPAFQLMEGALRLWPIGYSLAVSPLPSAEGAERIFALGIMMAAASSKQAPPAMRQALVHSIARSAADDANEGVREPAR